MPDKKTHTTFHWTHCRDRLVEFGADEPVRLSDDGTHFVSGDACLYPPLVCPLTTGSPKSPGAQHSLTAADHAALRAGATGTEDVDRYLGTIPEELPLHCLILMQAGAVSLGLFEAGEVVATKSMRRYVVRGKGRAQPAHLAMKGKSRYGSRLRLQNAQRLLDDTNHKLDSLWEEFGSPAHIYVSAPARMWSDLFRTKFPPPFDVAQPTIRIPLDIPKPTTEVLLRTYRAICHGRVERPN